VISHTIGIQPDGICMDNEYGAQDHPHNYGGEGRRTRRK